MGAIANGSASSGPATITGLLQAVQRGERAALDALFPLVYDELCLLAHRQRQGWHGDLTLNTTAVVHEAYLKLVDQKRLPAESRAHFFGVAAKAMRHILCNYTRDRGRQKRGGGVQHVSIDPGQDPAARLDFTDEQSETLTALDEALRRLEESSARQARIVECRFFGGMSVEDTAAALGVSPRTVKREWSFARAWLRREMQGLVVPFE
ncbi:MAG: sigma-70 family RNA polymerase sigma factor [Gemmatimonadaceae bacterium]